MKVKEVANLAGISVRTLHHYDDIGLLHPSNITESGYRLYSQKDLQVLQQILFFKELDFPLKQIKTIISNPSYNQEEALRLQRNMLLNKREHIDSMLQTIDKTINDMKGEGNMSNKERFSFTNVDFTNNPYEQEARELWGNKVVDESKNQFKKLKQDDSKLGEEFDSLYKELAEVRDQSPKSKQAQILIGKWYGYLNKIGNYSLDAFKGLGQMYVADERFTENIDQYGEGLAQFMCEAMSVYADNHQQ